MLARTHVRGLFELGRQPSPNLKIQSQDRSKCLNVVMRLYMLLFPFSQLSSHARKYKSNHKPCQEVREAFADGW